MEGIVTSQLNAIERPPPPVVDDASNSMPSQNEIRKGPEMEAFGGLAGTRGPPTIVQDSAAVLTEPADGRIAPSLSNIPYVVPVHGASASNRSSGVTLAPIPSRIVIV